MQRLTSSFTTRLFFTHVLVAILTGLCVSMVTFVMMWSASRDPGLDYYRSLAGYYAVAWLSGYPSGAPFDPAIDPVEGVVWVVSADDEVLWSRGDSGCRIETSADECPSLVSMMPPSDRFFERNGERWAQIVVPLITGERVIMHGGRLVSEPTVDYGYIRLSGYADLLLFEVLSRGLVAVPIALVVAWLVTRPSVRRLLTITEISRRFARGDLQTRIRDGHNDDIGRLAQQFDDMADALGQNISTLQALAQRNAELAQQAEGEAIKAERVRISRDLHDAIAQRLFSLSVSTTTLPDLIAQNTERGIQQAKTIAELAEQTLLDLRSLLVELRPANVAQYGLAQSLTLLFRMLLANRRRMNCEGKWENAVPFFCLNVSRGGWQYDPTSALHSRRARSNRQSRQSRLSQRQSLYADARRVGDAVH